ncbi:MAG: UTP--glucose-1-phosphate uridylyltransferase, partial [bacterium]
MAIAYKKDAELLKQNGQSHVIRFWPELGLKERSDLLAQVEALNFSEITRMRAVLTRAKGAIATGDIEPADVLRPSKTEIACARVAGGKALSEGKVGVILVAGGQGSRLGFDGPKGCFPVAPISGATLFEIHCRKILALERSYDCEIPFYVMTSKDN